MRLEEIAMKILITTDLFTTATNGVVTSVKNLWNELKQKGHDVRILTLSNDLHNRRDGDVYYIKSMAFPIYPGVRMTLSFRNEFLRELIEWNPDIIHSQCEFFTFQFASYISKKTKTPIVHTYHTMYEQYVTYVIPIERLGRRIIRWFICGRMKQTEEIVAPTYKVEESLNRYGIHGKIHVVPTGISLEQHQKRLSPEARLEKRRELGIADDETVLLNLGRLAPEKNVDELIDLYARAQESHPSLRLVIVGDGPAKHELERHAEKLALPRPVIFTGMVPPSEVQNYYQIGDIFVSASTSETQGLTYIEAAANGLPLLCRYDLCLKGVIVQGENGYQYTTSEEFLYCLDEAMKSPERIRRAGARSEEIAAKFDKHVFGDSIEQVYKTIAARKVKRRRR